LTKGGAGAAKNFSNEKKRKSVSAGLRGGQQVSHRNPRGVLGTSKTPEE